MNTITATGKTPNLFSLLSWESATIALKVLDLIENHKNNISLIATALQSFTFEGPRGKIYFDSKTNTSISPLFNAIIISGNDGKCEMEIIGESVDVYDHFEKLTNQDLNNSTSAWYNSYVCI